MIVMKKLSAFLPAVVLISFASTVSPGRAADQAITMGLGASSGLRLERPFKTILIGDPDIVDVVKRSDRSVILQSLNLGATNVIFLDEESIAIANVRILVCKTAASPVAYRPDLDDVCPVRNVERGTP
jgi:Flp pilus assembly secretin CpaC